MFEIISFILVFLFVAGVGLKCWQHRLLFASLSSSDWIKYIFGFALSTAFASIVIIGGVHAMDESITGVIGALLKIGLIFVALFITCAIFIRFIPDVLKPFYKLIDN
jgi:hypothetical protein